MTNPEASFNSFYEQESNENNLAMQFAEGHTTSDNRNEGESSWVIRKRQSLQENNPFKEPINQLVIEDPVLLLRLTKTFSPPMTEQELYEATRGNWAISMDKAQVAKYAYALNRGVVIQIYNIECWSETEEISGRGTPRLRFTGKIALDRQQHIGRSLAHYFKRGEASPTKFLNCDDSRHQPYSVNKQNTTSDNKQENLISEVHEPDDALNWRDQQLVISDKMVREPVELPIKPGQEKQLIPAINLSTETILETYKNSPVLLKPFSRSCSISARTLSGMIDEIEIEVFAQGSTWIIETQDGNWLVLPRPRMLTRRSQMQSLARLFEIKDDPDLPAELELLEPGRANVVEHGHRWYLAAKGRIGLQSDPLQFSLESRLKNL